METPRTGSRLAFTATTLVAMVAMSASASGPARCDVAARSESNVVRAVAAVFAAAARDLLVVERSAVAPAEPLLEGELGPAARIAPSPADAAVPAALLGERLLDLPPPAA